MLLELRVENLLLIERAELALAPGLNVLTGETGAGKTVLAHALDLLLGGRARPGIVRPGAPEAYVEGVFELPDPLPAELAERLPDDAEELVLARRVGAEGRTRALLNGRTIAVGDLRDIAGALISFYGQHEHRRLTLASAQLEILDGFCGPDQRDRRAACAGAHARARALEAALEDLRERAGSRERELDLLTFELEEIEAAAPDPAEHAALLEERERLRHVESLRAAAWGAAGALEGAEGDGDGAASRLASGVSALEAVAGVDAGLDLLTERQRALSIEAADLASELMRYVEGLGAEPGRLEAVEARLAELDRLMRKHGGTVEAVLAHAEDCRRRRDELLGAEEALEGAQAGLAQARAELESVVGAFARPVRVAAPPLAEAVRERLAALAMEGATFEIALEEREPGPSGADAVEFLIAPNPGVPAGPLKEVASGGRAVARHARADGGRPAGRGRRARLRRGRRRHRWPHRPRRRSPAARAGRRAPGPVHHPPASDRLARRPALRDRQGHGGRAGAYAGHAARRARGRVRARAHARLVRGRPRGAPPRDRAAPGGVNRRVLDLDRPKDLGQLLGEALAVWGANLVAFLSVAAGVVFTVDIIMGVGLGEIAGRYQSNPPLSTVVIETAISVLVTTPLITAMLVHTVIDIGAGRAPSVREAITKGLDVFAPVLLAVCIFVIGVIGGLSLFVVPGIFIYVSWYFVTQAVVIDGARGLAAVARSAELVRGRWWRVLGVVLVIHVAVGLPENLLGLGVTEVAKAADSRGVDLAGRMVLEVFAISLEALMGTLLYFDLRARLERRRRAP